MKRKFDTMKKLPVETKLQIFSMFNKKQKLDMRTVAKDWDALLLGDVLHHADISILFERALTSLPCRRIVLNNPQINSLLLEDDLFLLKEIHRIGYSTLFINAVFDRNLLLKILSSPQVSGQYSDAQRSLLEAIEKDFEMDSRDKITTRVFNLLDLAKESQDLAIALVKSPLIENVHWKGRMDYSIVESFVSLVAKQPAVAQAILTTKERFNAMRNKHLLECAKYANLSLIDYSLLKKINDALTNTTDEKNQFESIRRNMPRALEISATRERKEQEEQSIAADEEMESMKKYYDEQLKDSSKKHGVLYTDDIRDMKELCDGYEDIDDSDEDDSLISCDEKEEEEEMERAAEETDSKYTNFCRIS